MKIIACFAFLILGISTFAQTAPTLSAPENGALLASNNVVLNWDDVSGSTGYTCQYDTVNTFDSANLFTNTDIYSQMDASNLPFGTTYYWRVKTETASGSSNWSEVRRFTTVTTVALQSPNNNETINGTYAIFKWYDVIAETGFIFQADTTNTFDSPNLISETVAAFNSGTGFPAIALNNLTYGATYYWRVAILNGANQSGWSEVRNFTVINTVTLNLPNNNALINGISLPLNWHDVTGETGFIYQVDAVETFDSPNLISETRPSFNVGTGFPAGGVSNLAFGTTYYWRVAILNGQNQSGWSQVRNFTTTDAPVLNSPANNTINTGNAVSLQWFDVSGETGYVCQIDTATTFDTANLIEGMRANYDTATGFPSIGLSQLISDTTYYWRVAIRNGSSQSGWSPVWRFATGSNLAAAGFVKSNPFVHPNPVQNELFVSANSEWKSYTIYNSNGKAIANGALENSGKIEVGSLQSGLYFVEFTDRNDVKIRTKFIKN